MPVLPRAPFLYAIVDAGSLRGRDAEEVTRALVRGGATLVQARGKGLGARALTAFARSVVSGTRGSGVPVLVNDRPDVACVVEADGVHVGQGDLDPDDARRLLGPSRLVGVSTHNTAQLEAALASTADYVAVGPVFATATKADPDPVVGLDFVRAAVARAQGRTIVGIGGITRVNAEQVIAAGAVGVVVIGDLLREGDPELAARALAAALEGQAR